MLFNFVYHAFWFYFSEWIFNKRYFVIILNQIRDGERERYRERERKKEKKREREKFWPIKESL